MLTNFLSQWRAAKDSARAERRNRIRRRVSQRAAHSFEPLERRLLLARADTYEPDNSAVQAQVIRTDGAAQTHNIHKPSDVDWVKFTLDSPSNVRIETKGAKRGDTQIGLYGPNDAAKLIEYNDNNGFNHYSRIERTDAQILDAGTYYVRIDESGNDRRISKYLIEVRASPVTVAAPAITISSATSSEGLPALNPGLTYTVTGSHFTTVGSTSIDLVLLQSDVTTPLGTAQLDSGSGTFSAEIVMPTALAGLSVIEARQGNMTLATAQFTVLHAAEMIRDLFTLGFGRNPGPVNMSYWQTRTDKIGADLFGAMEEARLEYEASALRMDVFAFTAGGEPIPSPTGVAENDQLMARFTNAEPGSEASVHLVFQGVIVQSATEIVPADGTVDVPIQVPARVLPEVFEGGVSGEIDVIMVHGDQGTRTTLQLREGPRLLLKSAEVTEGQYIYFAIRGVTADEPVNVTIRHDWGTGSREQTWTIGRTDGSNQLDPPNAKLIAPAWLRGGAQSDGIEIDIVVGSHRRGYRATLMKGQSRDNIIAELIRTNGTGSIEAELRVLLTEEERVLADTLLGDDWEGNAAAIGDSLNELIVNGGGYDPGSLRAATNGASQVLLSTLLATLGITRDRIEIFNQLVEIFSRAHTDVHQNELEYQRLRPEGAFGLRDLKYFHEPYERYEYFDSKKGITMEHQGADLGIKVDSQWQAGIPIVSPVSGTVYYLGDGEPKGGNEAYGTMIVAVRFTLAKPQTFKNELGNEVHLPAGQELLMFFGHLRPSKKSLEGTPRSRFAGGVRELRYNEGGPVVAGFSVLGYLEDQGKNGDSSHPHVHVGIYIIPDANTPAGRDFYGARGYQRFNYLVGISPRQASTQASYLMPESVLPTLL